MNNNNLKNIEKVIYQGGVVNLDLWSNNELNDMNMNMNNNISYSNDHYNSNVDNYLNVKDSKSLLQLKEVINAKY